MPKGIDAKSAESRLLRFTRTPQSAAWLGARVFAILEDLHPVYENVFHANRVLMRLLKSRAIGNRRRIKHNDIRKHSFLEEIRDDRDQDSSRVVRSICALLLAA